MIDVAHARGVRVLAYYIPNSLWRSKTAVESGAWARYQAEVRTLLNRPTDVVWDMMGPEYIALRADAACYTDGHLSAAGARLVLADINREVAVHLRGIASPTIFPRATPLACLDAPGAGSGYDRSIPARSN